MSKPSTIRPLSLAVGGLFLISMTGIQVSHAADARVDPQEQAASVLKQPTSWISSAEAVQSSGHGNYRALDSQQQAQRVLQPAHEVAADAGPGQFMASESVDPHMQAIRVLHHTFY